MIDIAKLNERLKRHNDFIVKPPKRVVVGKIYELELSEKSCVEMSELKPGNKVQAIISYTVVEKTKSFMILRINHVYPIRSKRVT